MFWKCRFRYLVLYRDDEQIGLDRSADERFMIDLMTYRELYKAHVDEKKAGWMMLHGTRKRSKSLVLANKTKDLPEALIRSQLDSEKSTDLIYGKGNGLILLVYGGPSTGKTLTAKSVAEIAEKPLYHVTRGDIGTEPDEVEPYLESVLHLGKIWKGVVLLGEADVF
ncbi:hypothetical protein ACEPPN_001816 [Leptodophora sp. 'Broadleaf-Isolate-01']